MITTRASFVAHKLAAIANCRKAGNTEWQDRHTDTLESFVAEHFPSGSGFDSGTKLDFDRSTPEKLIFSADYHHMNDSGMYSGWSEHTVIVTPSLVDGFNLKITGRDRNDVKDYIAETFQHVLSQRCNLFDGATVAKAEDAVVLHLVDAAGIVACGADVATDDRLRRVVDVDYATCPDCRAAVESGKAAPRAGAE